MVCGLFIIYIYLDLQINYFFFGDAMTFGKDNKYLHILLNTINNSMVVLKMLNYFFYCTNFSEIFFLCILILLMLKTRKKC